MLRKRKMVTVFAATLVLTLLVVFFGSITVAVSGQEKIEITHWHQWTGIWTDILKRNAERFTEAQPNFKVKSVVVPEELGRKLLLAIASGTPPDLVSLTGLENIMFAERGALTPLETIIDPDRLDKIEKWGSTLITEPNRYKGHLWALSPYVDAWTIYYNKKLFKEVGLNPDSPPLDIETLDRYAEKLTTYDAAGNIERMGFYPGWNPSWIVAFGGDFMKGETVWFNKDPKAVAALEWIASYSKKYGVGKVMSFQASIGEERAGGIDPFISGRKAMELQGNWFVKNIDKFAPEGFSYGVTPYFPYPPGGRKNALFVRSAYGAMAVPVGAKHPQGAVEYAIFRVGYGYEEERTQMSLIGGSTVLSDSVYNHPAVVEFRKQFPQWEVFYKIIEANNWTTLKTPVDGYLFDRLASAVEYVQLLKKTPQEALDDAAAEVQKELNRILSR